MTQQKRPRLPKAVLFACSRNVIRSPMAAALARDALGPSVPVTSAGLSSGELDPFALAAMAEIGVSMSEHTPHTLVEVDRGSFDLVIALSADAHAEVRSYAPEAAVEYWPMPDPSVAEGSREQRLAAYRQVRDMLLAKIKARFSPANA